MFLIFLQKKEPPLLCEGSMNMERLESNEELFIEVERKGR